MIRLFPEHRIRRTQTLDGCWEFVPESERSDDTDGLPASYTRRAYVTTAWETMPGLEAYRGKGWFRRTFQGEGLVRLVFGGVSHTATVYVDGHRAGEHYDAFTPFEVVTRLEPGEHECVVAVDNSFGPHSALHKENDYYTYGGITRPVELQFIRGTAYIDRIYATPARNEDGWGLDLAVKVSNAGADTVRVTPEAAIAGVTQELGSGEVPANGNAMFRKTVTGLDVDAWSAESPRLYELSVTLADGSGTVDDKIDRIGFRDVRVDGRKILLNGTELRLRGYNRHEDHPHFGNALPLQAMARDLELIRDLGCNAIRTCHYPNDMRFLDLCDEQGIYLWEESHARNVPFDTPAFDRQIADTTREMLEWHYNRPSIVIWGCLNECDSVSDSGVEIHRRVLNQLRTFDGSRPVTFASNKAERDRCLGAVDIVSWNIYTGWYSGSVDAIREHLENMLRWLHSADSGGGAEKPVIMSEFGAGAIYGNRQRCRAHWSEEYQCDVLDECLRVYLNHPDVAGSFIWQFCDVRITQGWWKARPRTYNNKGTVDEFRRPKLVYETVTSRMNEASRLLQKSHDG